MSKIRVHELAKELGKSSKDVIYALKGHGIDVESHMSTIATDNAEKIRRYFTSDRAVKPETKAVPSGNSNTTKTEVRMTENRNAGQQSPSDNTGANNAAAGNAAARTAAAEGTQEAKDVVNNRNMNNNNSNGNRNNSGDRNNRYNNNRNDGQHGGENRSDGQRNGENRQSGQRGYGDNRQGQGGQRSSGDNRQGQGGQRSYGDNRQGQGQGGQRSYGDNRQGQGQGGQRSYGDNRQGQGGQRSYGDNRQGQGQGGQRSYGDNRQGQGQGGQRSYGDNRQGQGQGGQRSYGDNRQGQGGQRSYGDNRQGQGQGGQRSYGDNRQGQGGQRTYGDNRQGQGGQRPYGDRNNNGGGTAGNGERSNNRYGNRDNRPAGQRPSGENRPYNNNGGQRSYGDRNNGSGAGNNRTGGSRPYNNSQGGNRSYGGQRSGDNRGGQGGRGDGKFNLDTAITKEVVVTKDTTRENRRTYKDNKDKDKVVRDRDKKVVKGKNVTVSKKSGLTPPAPKPKPVIEKVTNIILPETVTLKELGDKMKVPGAEIVKKLFLAGKMVSLNSEITYEEAEEIALEYDVLCEHEVVIDVIEELLREDDEDEKDLVERPPVVCVMGHVDHGKTSILDAIRKTNVTTGEAGGITQHIGAYVVDVKGNKITFLDTPGHEAFTAMRLRGAQSTDIAILVVAADDGVMPQTIEAINHAKAAGIEIIVAINKMDKPSANIDRVKQELTEYELIAEDWGGQTIMVPVSAHTGQGLSELLDMILLVAEMRELKANPDRKARGLILEAQLDKGRGPVATVLVQKGTLKVGDCVAVGTAFGKVRAMIDDKGRRVKEAGPSTPVEILGLGDVPLAGEVFIATNTEKEARAMADTFIANNREKLLADTKAKLSLDGLFTQIQAGQIKDLNIVVKADVQGSVEAVKQSLVKLSNEEVAVKVIHGGVGAINESPT